VPRASKRQALDLSLSTTDPGLALLPLSAYEQTLDAELDRDHAVSEFSTLDPDRRHPAPNAMMLCDQIAPTSGSDGSDHEAERARPLGLPTSTAGWVTAGQRHQHPGCGGWRGSQAGLHFIAPPLAGAKDNWCCYRTLGLRSRASRSTRQTFAAIPSMAATSWGISGIHRGYETPGPHVSSAAIALLCLTAQQHGSPALR
jgi:hypothetical protein